MRLVLASIFIFAIAPLAVADPIDCSSGCTIVTCGGTICTVYNCDANGCTIIGQYPDMEVQGTEPDPESNRLSEVRPLYGTEGNGLDCGRAACTIKTCDSGECTLFGFNDGEAFHLGTLDDTESVLNAMAKDFVEKEQ